ncbi:hypothetical protein GJ496_005327 [Pomphorhynchus laevis]|nr:hypothetical protein GJ496_005327 [Pomphorhynchus laevis]
MYAAARPLLVQHLVSVAGCPHGIVYPIQSYSCTTELNKLSRKAGINQSISGLPLDLISKNTDELVKDGLAPLPPDPIDEYTVFGDA